MMLLRIKFYNDTLVNILLQIICRLSLVIILHLLSNSVLNRSINDCKSLEPIKVTVSYDDRDVTLNDRDNVMFLTNSVFLSARSLTGRVFFNRFPSLFAFLLTQLQEATKDVR